MNEKAILTIFAILLLLALSSCSPDDGEGGDTYVPPDLTPEGSFLGTTVSANGGGPLILVHYMPWYDGPSSKAEENDLSKYGGHWTRWGNMDCTQTINVEGYGGRKAIVHAKQYPLTGPYHSRSTALLEYQASLFKIAGIDGAIFDWYGAYDANDFGGIHEHTKAMVAVLERAGLKFNVCYEDNTLNMMGKSGDEAVAIGKISFDWAQNNWFSKTDAYTRYDGRPIVLNFGPQHFNTQEKWEEVFSGTDRKPYFVDLDNRFSWSDASFNWPPVYGEGNITTKEQVESRLNTFFKSRQRNKPYKIASVFSAFEDDYANHSYGYMPYKTDAAGVGTDFFDLSWTKTMEEFQPNMVQIVTWNDYGEGTIIEPTIERGYNELEYVQDWVKEQMPSFPFTKEDLRWPLEFYKLRYMGTASAAQEAAIVAATNALFAGDAATFRNEAAKTGATVNVSDLKPLLR
jgi:hypothetical protein